MDMTGEYRIPAPRQRVWEALNDPATLKAAIPGCEELNKLSDNELEARVKAKVGPVSATFTGKVTLNDLNPPESYRIAGEGKGGAAGYAKGGAEVNLAEDGADTILRYTAKADVGGKLAQIGSRLIQGTAKKMADDFFGKFSAIVGERYAAERRCGPAGRGDDMRRRRQPRPRRPPPQRPTLGAGRRPRRAAGQRSRCPRHRRRSRKPRWRSSPSARRLLTTPKVPAPTAKPGQPWYVWLIGAVVRGHRAVLAAVG